MSVLRTLARKVPSLIGTSGALDMARGAGVVFAIQVAGAGLGYALQVLLARWMAPPAYGTYVFAMSCATLLATAGSLGFPTAVLRFIPQYAEQQRLGLLSGLLRTSRGLVLAAAAFLAALGSAAAWALHAPAGLPLLPLVAGCWMAPLLAPVLLETEFLRARRRLAWAYAPMQVLRPLLVLGSAFLVLHVSGSLTALHVLASLAGALILVWSVQHAVVRRTLRSLLASAQPRRLTRHWLAVALPLLLAKGFLVLITKTDLFFIGALLSPERVGIYNAALRTAHAMAFAGFAVDALAAPAIARRYAQGNPAALQQLVTRRHAQTANSQVTSQR